jgi:hypothetical protein
MSSASVNQEILCPISAFQKMIDYHNERLVLEKTRKYNIDAKDILQGNKTHMAEINLNVKFPESGNLNRSFFNECDLSKSVQNSFKKKLQRRTLRVTGQLNLTE